MECERYAVVDVETTGFSPARDRIVEVACALVDGDTGDGLAVTGTWSTLVNPFVAIPPYATAVHGIDDSMVWGAPWIGDALAELREFTAGRTVVAHCAGFDLSFLGPTIATEGLCTMRLSRRLIPEAPNHKNQTLRGVLNVDRMTGTPLLAHRALGDAIVTAHVLIECRRRFAARTAIEGTWNRFAREHALVRIASVPERLAS